MSGRAKADVETSSTKIVEIRLVASPKQELLTVLDKVIMKITRNELDEMDFSDVSDGTKLAPVHPGEVLLRDFMEPLEVTQHKLAVSISVPPRRINEIVHLKRSITADTALRLARFFGTTPDFWTSLQASYDTELVRNHIIDVLNAIPRYTPKIKLEKHKMAA